MDLVDFIRYVGALFVTLALLGGLALTLRRFGPSLGLGAMARPGARGPRRLEIAEVLPLDPRRRLVLVREGDREHLLLLGAGGETVVESRPAPAARDA